MTIADEIEALVRSRPGQTESELAEKLFPDDPYQQRVNPTCRRLIREGRLQRQGRGGPGDPFRYYLTQGSK
jgi:hypothetical protein